MVQFRAPEQTVALIRRLNDTDTAVRGVNRCQVAHSWGDDFRERRPTDQYPRRMVRLCCPHQRGCHRCIRGTPLLSSAIPAMRRAQPQRLCDWSKCTKATQSAVRMWLRGRHYKICKRYHAAARPPFMSGKYHQTSN